MLISITCRAEDASDLGFLLHKNPAAVNETETAFGRVVVFYPEASERCCTSALLLEVDPVRLVRARGAHGLDQYVNDRPYAASSLASVAIATVFGTALNGRSRDRQERVGEKMPLSAMIAAVRCRGGAGLIERLFVPLGYRVTLSEEPLRLGGEATASGGVFALTIEGMQTVQDLLTHLYVLLPVLDNAKHYFVGEDEVDKLLKRGAGWLPRHPERELITQRYLMYRSAMVRSAISQLDLAEESGECLEEADDRRAAAEEAGEAPLRLNDLRLRAAQEAVLEGGPPKRVLDLGCGEGRLLRLLLRETRIEEICGVDVSTVALERAARALRFDSLPERQRARVSLLHGSLVYRDERFRGYDVATLIEVIEHLDPPRLEAMAQVVFGHARPARVVVTTPNAEYNVLWPSLPGGSFRHADHRFEWPRPLFRDWAERIADRFGYDVAFRPVGPEHADAGPPTQMAVFERK
ncbi:MAG TPA: 3' terminal RNA ribose 2'-O-methyltransferase Hen1 [Chthonomonadaceae bacterium]|nr:3' terminal RNA ribose 2'-O-methyltransferase Hen1 [Chthonomonadaceae bacterium]